MNDESLSFGGDTHWNNHGMRVAARALAERLKRYDLVQKGRRRREPYTMRNMELTREGNIFDFGTLESRRTIGPVTYRVDVVEDAAGEPYADDSNSRILLVGDSNLGIPALIEVGGRFSAHVADEIGMPVETMWKRGGFVSANVDLARQGASLLEGRRVVVWIGTGAWLADSAAWRAVKLP